MRPGRLVCHAALVADAHYDLLVLGSGPGGQKAAIAAAKLGKRAAIVERRHMVGGVCINTGTIPSKTLREAVLYLTGMNMRDLYGQNYRVKEDITVQDLLARTTHVIGRETEVVRSQLHPQPGRAAHGTGRFVDDAHPRGPRPRDATWTAGSPPTRS